MAGPRSLPPLAAALLAAGCAATGPAFTGAPPPGDKALVYIYRPYSKWVSALQDAGFDVNGAKIGILDSGGYTYFHAPPGHYDIRQFWPTGLWTLQEPALWKDMHLAADFKSGETHYIRLQVQEAAAVRCPGPSTAMTEADGSESRYFSVVSSVYDPTTYTSYPVGSRCIGVHLSEVPAEVGRGEIQAQKFQMQNKAMPIGFKP